LTVRKGRITLTLIVDGKADRSAGARAAATKPAADVRPAAAAERRSGSALQHASRPPAAGTELGALTRLRGVEERVTLEWGTTQITLQEARELAAGDLLRLDQQAGDLVDVRVNGHLFGRGRLVMVGETYGVQLVKLVGDDPEGRAAERG